MISGIIVKGIGGFYYVKTNEGIFECRAKGIFRKKGISPIPGDEVDISIIDIKNKIGQVDVIKDRRSKLIRPLVANVDQVAIVVSVKSPEPDLMLVDNILISAILENLQVLLCFNKIDLEPDSEYISLIDQYKKAGFNTILLSYIDNIGFEGLKEHLQNKITVLAGQSGVGKSSILNKIINSYTMETGDISKKIERGKHTTRHAELIQIDEYGYVLDTPGFSSFKLHKVDVLTLQQTYPEFKEYTNLCKFSPCSHIKEPGCRVKEALEQGIIGKDRYDRYIKIYDQLKKIDPYR